MSDKNWREWAFIYGMFATIQWLFFTHIAMLFYAGGTILWPGNSGYSFQYNFLSDLGFNPAHSGKSNTISSMLWFIGAILGTLGYIFFAMAFPDFFSESKLDKRLSTIASILLIVLAIFLFISIFVINNPEPYYDLISTFVLIGLYVGFIMIPLWVIAIFHNEDVPNRFGVVWLILYLLTRITGVAGLLTVGNVVEASADYTALEVLQFWVIREKILLYVGAVVNLYLNYNWWKRAKS